MMEEIRRLGSNLEDKEAGYWIACVGERSGTAEGRAELISKGFLREEYRHLANPADVARRGSYVALKYRVNKRLQMHLSEAGLMHGICDRCVPPKVLKDPASLELLSEGALAELAEKRLTVLDGAFSEAAMRQMQAELKALRDAQLLQNDPNDVCNPRQEARYLPFLDGDAGKEFRERCPKTMEVIRRVCGLPALLEERMGLELMVPQSAMVTCYPAGASYKMHLDSYALQGGHNDVPRKVTLLLYCNVDWTPAVGGQLRAWAPFDPGRGAHRDIEPRAGRLVAFMSEEIWHEVTESSAERYALTLWVHDKEAVEKLQR